MGKVNQSEYRSCSGCGRQTANRGGRCYRCLGGKLPLRRRYAVIVRPKAGGAGHP